MCERQKSNGLTWEWSAHTRLKHHQPVPNQYKGNEPWVRGKREYGLTIGRREKPILGFLLKLFWGKCPAEMTYHPKKGKNELESLGTCYRS